MAQNQQPDRPDAGRLQQPAGRPEGNREGRGEERTAPPEPGLKDQDDPTSDSYGNTRDSGEGR